MRAGTSQRGSGAHGPDGPTTPRGISHSVAATLAATASASGATGSGTRRRPAVAAAKASEPAAKASGQPTRRATQPYASQKTAYEMVPAMTPIAASAANAGPRLSARK